VDQTGRDTAAADAERQAQTLRRERALREDFLRLRMGLGAEQIAEVLDSGRAAAVPLGSNAAQQLTYAELGL
jgi:hypothetical protein